MTGKKKRGLLSWLGFGEEEQNQQANQQVQDGVQQESDQSEAPSQTPVAEEVKGTSVEEPTDDTADESQDVSEPTVSEQTEEAVTKELDLPEPAQPEIVEQEKPTESFFTRLKRSLSRTKENIGAGFFGMFKGKKIDDDFHVCPPDN